MNDVVKKEDRPLAAAQNSNPAHQLLELAIDKDLDIDKLERLMDLQKQWEEDQARKLYFEALSSFQSALPEIKKTGIASFEHRNGPGKTEYTFAKLEDITKAIKPFLSQYGLSYSFKQTMEGSLIKVQCTVSHSAGHSENGSLQGAPDNSGKKNAIQQIASTVSYLRRYTLTGLLGIVAEDDDDGQDSEPATGAQSGNEISDEVFQEYWKNWKPMIKEGRKTPEEIIVSANTKGVFFTDDQLNIIYGQ